MTSLYSNAELLYSMPAPGATNASAVITRMSSAAPMPITLASIWPLDRMVGKSLHFRGSGSHSLAGAYTNVLTLGADVTAGTYVAGVGCVSGACSALAATQTVGTMGFEIDATCQSVTTTNSGWIFDGFVEYGYNGSTAITTRYNVGGLNVAGVATAVVIPTSVPTFFEVFYTWSTAATASYLNKFKIYAEN